MQHKQEASTTGRQQIECIGQMQECAHKVCFRHHCLHAGPFVLHPGPARGSLLDTGEGGVLPYASTAVLHGSVRASRFGCATGPLVAAFTSICCLTNSEGGIGCPMLLDP